MALLPKRNNTARPSGYGSRFNILFVVFLVISIALWMFYRWLFNNDSSIFAIGALSVATAWFWAYLIGYGGDQHTGE